jgi:acyl-CoA synthetase (AMP-forming)/AMP-acid ligase II
VITHAGLTKQPSSAMTSVGTLVDRAAGWFGDAIAVTDSRRRSLSFRQVGERSSRLANALIALSPATGERVALLMPNRAEWMEADFAIAKAGKVRVPINVRLSDGERTYVLGQSGAETLIADAVFADFAYSMQAELPALTNVIVVGGIGSGGLQYESLLARGSESGPDLAHRPESYASIMYTSGTTGRPKGATVSNRGRLAATMNMLSEEIEARAGDTMIHVGSLAHGSGSKLLAYFIRGARNLIREKFDPEEFLRIVEEERGTATFVVPTMISMIVEAARSTKADVSSLKTITYGGAPIAPAKLQEALDCLGPNFVQVYGSCEAPHPVLVMTKQDHVVAAGKRGRLASVGREVAGAEVRIVGPAGGDVAVGDRGEMWIRGDGVMTCYWDNPTATTEVLQDGWYHTGDVAERDEDGYYYIVDRERDLIISGGLNIYPSELEAVLSEHTSVGEVAVIGVPDERWGESVKALVVLRPSHPATTPAELIDFARQRLAGYKKPQSVEFVESLPKGATGKILKRELKALYWKDAARGVN